jgi:hypothetical protein
VAERVEIHFTAKDLTKRGIRSVQKGLQSVAKHWKKIGVAAGVALAAMILMLKKASKAFQVQEDAEIKLLAALRPIGPAAQTISKNLRDFASELQTVTRYGDELILSNMALLASFTRNEEKIKAATTAAMDMAAAQGIDLKAAMLLLGRAAVGETGTLSRYGIILEKGLKQSEKFEAALKQLNKMFGGQAAAQAKSYAGRMEQLGNAYGDLWEKVGEGLGKNEAFLKSITDLTAKLQDPETVQSIEAIAGAVSDLADKTLRAVGAIGDFLDYISDIEDKSLKGLRSTLEGNIKEIEKLEEKLADPSKSGPLGRILRIDEIFGEATEATKKFFLELDRNVSFYSKISSGPGGGLYAMMTPPTEQLETYINDLQSKLTRYEEALLHWQERYVNLGTEAINARYRTNAERMIAQYKAGIIEVTEDLEEALAIEIPVVPVVDEEASESAREAILRKFIANLEAENAEIDKIIAARERKLTASEQRQYDAMQRAGIVALGLGEAYGIAVPQFNAATEALESNSDAADKAADRLKALRRDIAALEAPETAEAQQIIHRYQDALDLAGEITEERKAIERRFQLEMTQPLLGETEEDVEGAPVLFCGHATRGRRTRLGPLRHLLRFPRAKHRGRRVPCAGICGTDAGGQGRPRRWPHQQGGSCRAGSSHRGVVGPRCSRRSAGEANEADRRVQILRRQSHVVVLR